MGRIEDWIDSKLLSSRNRRGTAIKVFTILGLVFVAGFTLATVTCGV